MGLSISASAAIIFIASVIVFGTILGAVDEAGQSLVNSEQTSADRLSDIGLTHIMITNVDEANCTITVLNDGSTTIFLQDVDILINGSLSNDNITTETVDGVVNTNIWLPREQLTIQMKGDLNGTAIKVVAGNGVSAYA